jgi:catechol 2,3-dioxygenase-like lactoylglutathione lyase family enzyme
MIDHTGVVVSEFEKSKKFYSAALAPIGLVLVSEFPASLTGDTDIAGFGAPPNAEFWIVQGIPNNPVVHIAFRVSNRTLVDTFYMAAMAAGGRDNGSPGIRPQYHSNYYGAYVLDPDGHNIEAVCHEAI